MKLFSVHDKAVDSFAGVICLASDRDATEQFRVVCNQPDTAFYKHPADFTLFQIGTYNTDTGEITPMTPKLITNATSLKEQNDTSFRGPEIRPETSPTPKKPVQKKTLKKKGKTK